MYTRIVYLLREQDESGIICVTNMAHSSVEETVKIFGQMMSESLLHFCLKLLGGYQLALTSPKVLVNALKCYHSKIILGA